jgi:hypothetical protein
MQLEAFAEEGHSWASEAVALAQVPHVVVEYCCCWCVQRVSAALSVACAPYMATVKFSGRRHVTYQPYQQ